MSRRTCVSCKHYRHHPAESADETDFHECVFPQWNWVTGKYDRGWDSDRCEDRNHDGMCEHHDMRDHVVTAGGRIHYI